MSIDEATRIINPYEATSRVTQLYLDRIRRHIENEERDVDLWVLVVPEFVKERCTPKAKRTGLPLVRGSFGKKQSKRADIPLLETIIDQRGEGIFEDVPDFHRQIRAACLNIAPTQIVRETTLNPLAEVNSKGYPTRRTQDEATVAWNIATGLYYKTQENPPWKLHEVRPGVCYIGLVCKNLPNEPNGHVCCAAQMFLSEGDGVVFRGANGPWKLVLVGSRIRAGFAIWPYLFRKSLLRARSFPVPRNVFPVNFLGKYPGSSCGAAVS